VVLDAKRAQSRGATGHLTDRRELCPIRTRVGIFPTEAALTSTLPAMPCQAIINLTQPPVFPWIICNGLSAATAAVVMRDGKS